MSIDEIKNILTEKGLKVTPQRMAILGAVHNLNNHPSAENIIDYINQNYPNIAVGTVYKVLETFVEKHILVRVKTDKDIMRYDPVITTHHHLYSIESDMIADYTDENLDELINDYFKKKRIKDFQIDNIKLQITGRFLNNKS